VNIAGIPEPPLSVQVEVGPQEGTLLLTWLPVTIDSSGFSNGAVVTGYMVYADGKRVKEADGPTSKCPWELNVQQVNVQWR
jgi:RIMS-binding protein 2